MSYNSNFYNNFQDNTYAFHGNYAPIPPCNFSMPPPPIPPPLFIPPWVTPQPSDQEYVKSFEGCLKEPPERKPKIVSISEARDKITNLLTAVEEVKRLENILNDKVNTLSNEKWSTHVAEVAAKRMIIENTLFSIGGTFMDQLKSLLVKRCSKRRYLKKAKQEKVTEKEKRKEQMKENSRKIDENLKKIHEDIIKAKQELEDKAHADTVLKEVLRKKGDAKKCLVKLNGLMDLRKARMNTVKGRGDAVSESEMDAFKIKIDKLIQLWTIKLASYEKEESDLRAALKQKSKNNDQIESENDVLDRLKGWRQLLFGDGLPQANYKGNAEKFVATRAHWDRFISSEGSTLPMGWVIPNLDG